MPDAPPLAPLLAPAQPRRASHPSASARNPSRDPAFSLLLSLPRELRDRIYAYTLTSTYPFWWPNPAPLKHGIGLGLLTASRQVYEEAAPVLYVGNKFLFTHPSDCNMFRVVASPKYSALISTAYFRIREKDLRLWTAYLGSKNPERSLKYDLPKLKTLWIFLRCGQVGAPGGLAPMGGHAIGPLPPAIAAQVQAVQNALGQQVQALQQQVQNLTQAMANVGGAVGQAVQQVAGNAGTTDPDAHLPPPAMSFTAFTQGAFGQAHQHHHQHHQHHLPLGQPHGHGTQNNPPNPPAQPLAQQHPQPPHPHHHHGPFYASFLRWERELGLENLCLALQETRPSEADVKIVCIMRLPQPEVIRLCRLYPDELTIDRTGDARTRFRKLHGVEVSLEISGFDIST
jgi:hypothetical protein